MGWGFINRNRLIRLPPHPCAGEWDAAHQPRVILLLSLNMCCGLAVLPARSGASIEGGVFLSRYAAEER